MNKYRSFYYKLLFIISISGFSGLHAKVSDYVVPDSIQALKYLQIAENYRHNTDYDSSNHYYNLIKDYFIRNKDWTESVNIYKNLGYNYKNLGKFSEALYALDSALIICREKIPEQDSIRAEVFNAVGGVYYAKGDFENALKYYNQLLDTYEHAFGPDHAGTGKGYHNVGLIYYRKGNFGKALQYFETALSVWLNTLGEDHSYVANCYTNMSNVYFLKEEYQKSIELDLKALAIWKKNLGEDHPYIAVSYNNLGLTYKELGNFPEAHKHLTEALKIRIQNFGEHSLQTASTYSNIAGIFTDEAKYDSAQLYYRKALAFLSSDKSFSKTAEFIETLIGMAELQLKKGNLSKALVYCDSALVSVQPELINNERIDDPEPERIVQNENMILALIKKAEILDSMAENSVDQISYYNDALKLYFALTNFMSLKRTAVNSEEAKIFISRNSLKINERGMETAFKLYMLTGDKIYLEKAYYFAVQSKSQTLADALKVSEAEKFSDIPDSLLRNEKQLGMEIAYYETLLEELIASGKDVSEIRTKLYLLYKEIDNLIGEFESNFRNYYNLKYKKLKVSDILSVKLTLRDNESLFEYFWGENHIYLFILNTSEINVVRINNPAETGDMVRNFRSSLLTADFAGYIKNAFFLYQKLFKPAQVYLDDSINKIIIIPDRILNYLPFETLLTNEIKADVPDFSVLPYLLKKFSISYHYSSLLLERSSGTKQEQYKYSFVGFAPVFRDISNIGKSITAFIDTSLVETKDSRSKGAEGKYFGSLPESETEIKEIGELFSSKGFKTVLNLFSDATELALKSGMSGNSEFIHFATHGFVNEEYPALSGLVFYDYQNMTAEDGILYSKEIFNLNLNCNLAVLSACESGLGKVIKGEGIIGLARAFLYAGARNLVVSLWQVADKSTSELMVNFYGNILNGKDFTAALCDAKLEMIRGKKYSYPLEWSPFILIGK